MRKITQESTDVFARELERLDWKEVLPATFDVDRTTEAFHTYLQSRTEHHFPVRYEKIRSTDDPWIDREVRVKIRTRKRVFKKHGRCELWKILKKITNQMIDVRKKKYYVREIDKLREEGSHQISNKVLRNIADTERPKMWSVDDMANGKTEAQLGE